MMSKIDKASKDFVLKCSRGRKHNDCHGTFEKLIRNSEYSNCDDLKKLFVLAQILSFLIRIHVAIRSDFQFLERN